MLAMGLVLGCGDSSEGAGANGAGGGGNAGHDPGGGGGQGVGGTAGAGGADAFVGVGHIALSKLPYLEAGEPMLFDGLKASFYGSPEDDTGCSGLPAPPGCHVRVCEREVSFEPAAPEYVDAGTLTVTGGAFPVEAVQRANGMYEEEFDQLLFEGGEQLLIEVEGSGEVPACSVSLVAQSGVTVSAPDFDDPALTISRDEPLRVTWSGGENGEVFAILSQIVIEGDIRRSIQLDCVFDGEAGTGELPASLLSELAPPGTQVQSQVFAVVGMSLASSLDSAPWLVNASTQVTASTPTGATAVRADFTVE